MYAKDFSLGVRKAIITHKLAIRASCQYSEIKWLTQKIAKISRETEKRFRDSDSSVKQGQKKVKNNQRASKED